MTRLSRDAGSCGLGHDIRGALRQRRGSLMVDRGPGKLPISQENYRDVGATKKAVSRSNVVNTPRALTSPYSYRFIKK